MRLRHITTPLAVTLVLTLSPAAVTRPARAQLPSPRPPAFNAAAPLPTPAPMPASPIPSRWSRFKTLLGLKRGGHVKSDPTTGRTNVLASKPWLH